MEKLKRLALSLTLMSILAASAVAGETNTPPCTPGETHTPPCTSQFLTDDSTDPGQTETPPASDGVDLVGLVEAVLWSLSLF